MFAAAKRQEAAMPADQPDILTMFSRAFELEAHVLSKHPNLCWQQLHNRLQWEKGSIVAILEAARSERIARGAKSWLQTRNPFPESKTLTRVLAGHTDRVSACAFSSDGSWVVSASQDGTLKIWDTVTGSERFTLKGHESGVNACAISQDGAFVASASRDETLKVWDAKNGTLRATLRGHRGAVTDCKISPDGSYIVSAGWDCVLRLWDPQTGVQLRALPDAADASGHGPYACAFSPDGRMVATVLDGELCVWDVISGRKHEHLDTRFAQEGGPFDFTPNGRLIACANADATVSIWDLASDREYIQLQGHRNDELKGPFIGQSYYITHAFVSRCKFSPDGALLATSSNLGVVRIWDIATGRERASLTLHNQPITDLAFSPDSKYVISASEDQVIGLTNAFTGHELGFLEGHSSAVTQCCPNPDGTAVLSASDDGTLRLWRIPGEGENAPVPKHANLVSACSISSNGSFAVNASWDGMLVIWDMATGTVKAVCLGHLGSVGDCAISPDSRFVLSWSDDLTMRLWDPDTGQELAILPEGDLSSIPGQSMQTGTARKCAVSPDGSYAITVWMNLTVWDLSSGKNRLTLKRTDPGIGETCAIAPNASFFAAGNSSSIAIYDAESGSQRRILEGRAPLALSPDGRLIVHCGADWQTLVISDVKTGSQTVKLIGHTARIRACAFSHDGSFVVSGAEDGSVRIWDSSLGILLSETAGHAGIVWDCAITPDDGLAVTIGQDQMLRLWDLHTGAAASCFPLSAKGACFALDRARPTAIVGDIGGWVYLVDIISAGRVVLASKARPESSLAYKRLIVTAEIKKRNRLTVNCPLCEKEQQITEQQLGQEISCCTPGCGMRLQLNPFVIGEKRRFLWG